MLLARSTTIARYEIAAFTFIRNIRTRQYYVISYAQVCYEASAPVTSVTIS